MSDDILLGESGACNGSLFAVLTWAVDETALDDGVESIDLMALYQALHIHSVLGRLAEFEAYYMRNRRVRANVPLCPIDTVVR